jgi:hypothetical protein
MLSSHRLENSFAGSSVDRDVINILYTDLYIYIFVKLQLGFNPVAVVQQYNRQVTHITHKQRKSQYKNTTINDTTTTNTYTVHPATTNTTNTTKTFTKPPIFTCLTSLHFTSRPSLYLTHFTLFFNDLHPTIT